ncbi:hypothetical protein V6N11_036614 [Hibiscus sabdariffa]|uniref:RNase H type-1 domain-containing protein n=1 Tax=Hibiscus sabdariffa TaxID=183260 RepID=A0ABR2RB78_9ROSI
MEKASLLVESSPNSCWACINRDGAVSLSSGLGYIGGMIRDNNGNFLSSFNKFVSKSNDLQVELWDVFEGISLAWNQGVDRLTVQLDNVNAYHLLNPPSPRW